MKVALNEKRKKPCGFSFPIKIAYFKAFLLVFKLTKNPLFLKSDLVIRHYLRHLSFLVFANIHFRYCFTLVYTPGVFFLAQPMPRLTTPTITALDFPPLPFDHFHSGPPKQCCQILLYF